MDAGHGAGPLAGRLAVVVGGSGGIGRAVALSLGEAGAHLLITGRSSGRLDATLGELHARGIGAEGRPCVLDSAADVGKAAALAARADILAVAYGPFLRKPLDGTTPDDWTRTAVLDLALPGACVSAALPHMLDGSYGRIVLFGGTATDVPRAVETNCAYAAAKTGLSVLVRSVAASFGAFDVASILICPGFCDTEYLPAAERQDLASRMPRGTLVRPEEIARLALDFVLQERAVVNGATITADYGKKM